MHLLAGWNTVKLLMILIFLKTFILQSQKGTQKTFCSQKVLLYLQQFCSAKGPYLFIKDPSQNVNHSFRQPFSRPRSIMKIRSNILKQTGEDKLCVLAAARAAGEMCGFFCALRNCVCADGFMPSVLYCSSSDEKH